MMTVDFIYQITILMMSEYEIPYTGNESPRPGRDGTTRFDHRAVPNRVGDERSTSPILAWGAAYAPSGPPPEGEIVEITE